MAEQSQNKKLNIWWASLTINEKERIASKIATREHNGKYTVIHYPECSEVWNELTPEKQQAIYEHCTDAHGLLLKDWKEGRPFS